MEKRILLLVMLVLMLSSSFSLVLNGTIFSAVISFMFFTIVILFAGRKTFGNLAGPLAIVASSMITYTMWTGNVFSNFGFSFFDSSTTAGIGVPGVAFIPANIRQLLGACCFIFVFYKLWGLSKKDNVFEAGSMKDYAVIGAAGIAGYLLFNPKLGVSTTPNIIYTLMGIAGLFLFFKFGGNKLGEMFKFGGGDGGGYGGGYGGDGKNKKKSSDKKKEEPKETPSQTPSKTKEPETVLEAVKMIGDSLKDSQSLVNQILDYNKKIYDLLEDAAKIAEKKINSNLKPPICDLQYGKIPNISRFHGDTWQGNRDKLFVEYKNALSKVIFSIDILFYKLQAVFQELDYDLQIEVDSEVKKRKKELRDKILSYIDLYPYSKKEEKLPPQKKKESFYFTDDTFPDREAGKLSILKFNLLKCLSIAGSPESNKLNPRIFNRNDIYFRKLENNKPSLKEVKASELSHDADIFGEEPFDRCIKETLTYVSNINNNKKMNDFWINKDGKCKLTSHNSESMGSSKRNYGLKTITGQVWHYFASIGFFDRWAERTSNVKDIYVIFEIIKKFLSREKSGLVFVKNTLITPENEFKKLEKFLDEYVKLTVEERQIIEFKRLGDYYYIAIGFDEKNIFTIKITEVDKLDDKKDVKYFIITFDNELEEKTLIENLNKNTFQTLGDNKDIRYSENGKVCYIAFDKKTIKKSDQLKKLKISAKKENQKEVELGTGVNS